MPGFAKDTVTNRNCTCHRRVVGGAIALFLAFSQIVAAQLTRTINRAETNATRFAV